MVKSREHMPNDDRRDYLRHLRSLRPKVRPERDVGPVEAKRAAKEILAYYQRMGFLKDVSLAQVLDLYPPPPGVGSLEDTFDILFHEEEQKQAGERSLGHLALETDNESVSSKEKPHA